MLSLVVCGAAGYSLAPSAVCRGGVPARECGKMVRNSSRGRDSSSRDGGGGGLTLAAGDQELVSFACLQTRLCRPLPAHMHQDKCDGFAGGGGGGGGGSGSGAAAALIYHFNCRGSPEAHCPSAECREVAREHERRFPARRARRRSGGA